MDSRTDRPESLPAGRISADKWARAEAGHAEGAGLRGCKWAFCRTINYFIKPLSVWPP